MIRTYIHNRRLLKLADYLEKLNPKKFDLYKIRERHKRTCKTTACAIGSTIEAFPNHKFKSIINEFDSKYTVNDCEIEILEIVFPNGLTDFEGARVFFGLSHLESDYLFMPDYYPQSHRSAKYVSNRIKNFVKNGLPKEKVV